MPDIPGKDVLIYQGDGGGPEIFTKLASTQSDSVTINNSEVEKNTKNSGGFRELFAPGTIKSLSMNVRGVFEETADQDALLNLSMNASPSANFLFKLGGTRQLRGRFQVSSYEQSGETEGPTQFSGTFSSDGIIVIEAAA